MYHHLNVSLTDLLFNQLKHTGRHVCGYSPPNTFSHVKKMYLERNKKQQLGTRCILGFNASLVVCGSKTTAEPG